MSLHRAHDFSQFVYNNKKIYKKLPPKREYRFYTFGNYCLIVIRCRKSYFQLQKYNKLFAYPNKKHYFYKKLIII